MKETTDFASVMREQQESKNLKGQVGTLWEWLIQKAHENERLERECERLKSDYKRLQSKCLSLKSENERLQQAEENGQATMARKNECDMAALETLTLEQLDNLDIKTCNVLRSHEICLVKDVLTYSPLELLKLGNFGIKSLNYLVIALAEYGLKLADEPNQKRQEKADRLLMKARVKLTTIEELNLSMRAYNQLYAKGVKVVDDLRTYKYGTGDCLEKLLDDEKIIEGIRLALRVRNLSFELPRYY